MLQEARDMDHQERLQDHQLGSEHMKEPEQDNKKDELRILLVGKHGSGKTAVGNSILGKCVFESRLSEQPVTQVCRTEQRIWRHRKVMLIDTPDIFSQMDSQKELCHLSSLSSPGLHALLLVTPLGSYTEEDETVVRNIKKVFGEEALRRHVIILFTRKEDLAGRDLMEFIKNADEPLQKLIWDCGFQYYAFNYRVKGEEEQVQVNGLLEEISKMVERNGGQHFIFRKSVIRSGRKIKCRNSKEWRLSEEREVEKSILHQEISPNEAFSDSSNFSPISAIISL